MNLIAALEGLIPELKTGLENANSEADLEELRIDFLGRKGRLAKIMESLASLDPSERPLVGKTANQVKEALNAAFDEKKQAILALAQSNALASFDPTLPGRRLEQGSLHPISLVMKQVSDIFATLGYKVAQGPQVELDKYNFEYVNFPHDHPSRDMQDTLYITDNVLLRTHTTPVQMRTMLANKPPLAIISPGKVYRRDSDLTHTPMFHQIEGMYIDTKVSLADLRGTLTYLIHSLFGKERKVRFRPSFFPFTEPSIEVDISCALCGGKGFKNNEPCRVCKTTGWVEILGAGMIDPTLFTNAGYPDDTYTGFAFGMGVERIAMLKYGITDLRMFFQNDMRFLSQFASV
ncbi:phenylalanine--tRNA ligase subunit alpha [Desulfovibrio litoralis]|uniref:Phenylalanine--tRNA ligase alpha subunit n=1 Tax=Desulfovibrio litoralis DSM 11393 TaxID=1121455 RepID=A0A1M7T386_9BACT|nr:phenylalanine--tRNA ligase subunit alpha [Desulfovibrio litoralis]SHN65255.1 phenylalanyl-tRNA synthetase, alpha subunit [Desulfovibrio litoralis DSM 11393]